MGFKLKDELKEHKRILLPGAGVLIMAVLITLLLSSGVTPFSIDNSITGNELDDIIGGDEDNISKPDMQLVNGADYKAIIRTSKGDITVDLFETDTPKTVNNFVYLANKNFYDNLSFHRVIKGFVIQGGDPLGNGTGGPGYTFEDEIDADALGLNDIKVADTTFLRSFFSTDILEKYKNKSVMTLYEKELGYNYTKGQGTTKFAPYVIAMANSGANSNGSQFFITSGTFSGDYLNGKHTVFGKVISGYDVVNSIENVNVNSSGKPIDSIKIKSIDITQ